ncbi:hypothetical protein BJ085DRAFT_16297, partial [Dimargaris cristalligena]
MKIITLLGLAFASVALAAPNKNTCSGIRYRKEIHDCSADEINRLVNAMLKLKTKQSKRFPNLNQWDEFAYRHSSFHGVTHGVDVFPVYHRLFMNELELLLIEIDSTLVFPYWNAPFDAYAPEKSAIWSIVGSSQLEGAGAGCVPNGPFKDWKCTYPSNTDCIRRGFDPNVAAKWRLWNQEEVANIVNNYSGYNDFRQYIELGIHGQIHNIGDYQGTMSHDYSPYDPLFFFVHSYVEFLYVNWQKKHDTGFNNYPNLSQSIPWYN